MKRIVKRFFFLIVTIACVSSKVYSADIEGELASNPIPSSRGMPSAFLQSELLAIKDKSFNIWGVGLFSGGDPFSKSIQVMTGSKWSHVAAILTDQSGNKYCFESTGSATQVLKRIRPQVQISLWTDTVTNYSGSVASRQFAFAPTAQPRSETVTDFVHKYLGAVYEENVTTLFKSLARANTTENSQSLFCSELTALMLQEFGYLSADTPDARLAENYLPRDFSSKEFLSFNLGATLSAEFLEKEEQSSCGCCTVS